MQFNRFFLRVILASVLTLATSLPALALTDDINLPFKDDPPVIGRWQSVAFVRSPIEFVPEAKPTSEKLFLKERVFLPQGKTPNPSLTWTKGVLINSIDKTASKYEFKRLDGLEFMFLEWKSGDYIFRNRKPEYYVLIREADFKKLTKVKSKVMTDGKDLWVPRFNDCLVTVPPGGICKHPAPSALHSRFIKVLPTYAPLAIKMWQLDLRGQDVSKLPLEGRGDDLLHASFDTVTKFPKVLPKSFVPSKILMLGKRPGLGVKRLHKKGITGKGVSIAIIDQALLVDHEEYRARLRSYEELHWIGAPAQMHGGAVTSIAVGKNSGVAPGADLYYIANSFSEGKFGVNFAFLAKAVDRVTSFNKTLPTKKRIRVLAIARGFAPHEKGYTEISAAIKRAKKAGIFVVTSSLEDHYGFRFHGLGRDPMSNPENKSSYGPGLFWQHEFFLPRMRKAKPTLLVPMDSRTTASQSGVRDYVFYRDGGWSWSIPYIAGLYALACQVNPTITPEVFWKKALETGDSRTIKKDGKKFRLEKIVNPRRLLKSLKK